MGTEKNYIVVEGELKDNSSEEQEEEATPAEEAKSEDVEKAAVDDAGLPKIKVKTVPPVPKESHSGLNKHVYYVCNFGKSAC